MDRRPSLDRPFAKIAVLALLTFMVYWPVARFEFLNWDDPWYVTNNPLVKSWAPSNLYAIATEPCSKNFAPLTIFTLLVEHTLFGDWAGGYHIVHALLHVVNSFLVLKLVQQVTGLRWTAWITAALFAIHPIQIETVAWISSLKSILAATGMLVALLYWLKPERSSRDEGLGLLWLGIALLAKASAVVTPAIVLLYDLLIHRKKFTESLSRQIIPGLLCLMALFMNMHAQNQIWGGVRDHFDWGLPKILAVDSLIVWRYVGILLAPTNLSVMYDVNGSTPWGAVAVASIAWLLVTAIVWRVRHRLPLITWAYACWFVLLFPVLNLFPITTLMNDRYLYVPCILLFAALGSGLEKAFLKLNARLETRTASNSFGLACRPVMAGVISCSTVAIVMGYSAVAADYLQVWRNPMTLWSHAIQHSPDLPVVRIQWALTLHDQGRTEEACEVLNQVLEAPRTDPGDRKRIAQTLSEWGVSG